MLGRIHSLESFGTVDGPGIRFIVFFQGCLMRCLYCHNRDTWDTKGGKLISVEELMSEVKTYKHFIQSGGITASGGEALLQIPFLIKWFSACKKENIHTCLDTNGYIKNLDKNLDKLMQVTDIVLLDLKQMNNSIHQNLVGVSNKDPINFAKYLAKINKRTWIRYVVVPNWTDDEDSAHKLGKFVSELKNVEKIEILPYHKLGQHKWETLGKKYELDGIDPPPKKTIEKIVKILESYGNKVSF